jgi:hypothetical protein
MTERIAESSPRLQARLFPCIAAFGVLGAVLLVLWLLMFGVNEQRWKEQASTADKGVRIQERI